MSAKQTENRKEKQRLLQQLMYHAIDLRCEANSKDYDKMSLLELRMVEKSLKDIIDSLWAR